MAKGACTSIKLYGTIPVITKHINAYNDAQIPKLTKIPKGRSALGLATSSAHVAIVSKPTKAKMTTLAPEMTPAAPFGANGVQLSASITVLPAIITVAITANDIYVTTLLNFAVSFAPETSSAVMAATTAPAMTSISTTSGHTIKRAALGEPPKSATA